MFVTRYVVSKGFIVARTLKVTWKVGDRRNLWSGRCTYLERKRLEVLLFHNFFTCFKYLSYTYLLDTLKRSKKYEKLFEISKKKNAVPHKFFRNLRFFDYAIVTFTGV